MKISVCLGRIFIGMALMLFWLVSTAHAEMASVYGGRDGYCGSRTANGERINCSAMTAAHRRLPFGTQVRVCHSRCGVGILIYPPLPLALLVWMAPGRSLFRGCEGHLGAL
jgi:hypothetical protein